MADPYAPPRVYRSGDSGISQGFNSLAQMFAPVSPQDQYAAIRAAEAKQKMGGVAKLYELAKNPDAAKDPSFDLYGVITGLWNPSSSFGATARKDDTERRGQDIRDATDRYGIGVRSSDTRRGQDIHSSDTRRGQDVQSNDFRFKVGEDNKTDVTKTLLSPVAKDAVRYIPPDVAALYKLPDTQTGVVAAQPGERNYMPNGTVLEGAPKPLTEAEMKAKIIAGMTPQEQRAIAYGSTPVEIVRDPVTGQPKPVTRPQQLDEGSVPIPDKQSQVFNYRTPSGQAGTAVYDPTTGGLVDSQTRTTLPQGSQVQAPSGVQNKEGMGATTANQTESNRKAAGLDAMQLLVNQYSDLLRKNPGIVVPVGDIRGFAQNLQATLGEITAAAGPNAPISADQVLDIARRIAPSRDPAIQDARIMAADLAYKWAQSQNPSGEVSRQAFERALETLSGGMLRNNVSALESLNAVNQFIQRERTAVGSLRNPTAGPGVTAAPTGPRTIDTKQGRVTITPVE